MRKNIYFITLIFISSIIFGCYQSTINETDTTTTTTTTEGLIIDYFSGGGRSSAYEKIYISKDSAFREIGNHIETEINHWQPTEKELADLGILFEENKYLSITSTESEEEVFDRGGVVITILFKGNKKELNNSDDFFIDEKWKESFQTIKNRIIAYASSNSN